MSDEKTPRASNARRTLQRNRVFVGTVLALTALLSAVPAPVTAHDRVATVAYGDFYFTPNLVTMSLDLTDGNRVTFASAPDTTARHQPHSDPHVSHIVDALCFDSPVLNPGESVTVVVNPACAATGRVDYHCHIHPALMIGALLFTYDFLPVPALDSGGARENLPAPGIG